MPHARVGWALAVALLTGSSLFAQQEPVAQSRTGPTPPPNVLPKSSSQFSIMDVSRTISGVPGYSWRHGCGPTAVGMVVGYYDAQGYSELFDGAATSQTTSVNQGIASQGSGVRGSGTQRHYEDYSLPMDSGQPSPIDDSSETYPSGCHADDCIADFMQTSWSSANNFYGWSWSSRIAPSFTSYVNLRKSGYAPTCTQYYSTSLTWSVLTAEIDAGRPMVFLVDSDGNGGTDHFVTVVGYNDTPTQQYGCLDTWYPASQVRWCEFRPMSSSYSWGVWGGWKFTLRPIKPTAPFPADGAVNVLTTASLTWSNGGGANAYDVYFGTDSTPDSGEYQGTQTETTFDPGSLAPLTTYYWRIDARGAGGGETTGDVWQFQTAPPAIRGDFDDDDDVDQEDFGHLQACMTTHAGQLAPGCEDADLNGSGYWDADDFAIFQACFSGPNPAAPGCGS